MKMLSVRPCPSCGAVEKWNNDNERGRMKTPEEIKTAVRFARECGSGVELEGKQ